MYADDSLSPVALMRLTQIEDPDELLKDYNRDKIVVEEKLDGWKAQAIKSGDKVKIYSRRGEDKTENFPDLVKALQHIPDNTLVEGELVYWDNGKQDVGKVTSIAGSNPDVAIKKSKELPGKIKIHLYDVIWNKGSNISEKPFSERRKILESLIETSEKVLITKQYPFSEWQNALNKAVDSGGEGIVLKLKDKPYKYKPKGQNEPKPSDIMYKYKGGVGKSDSDDYVVYDYEVTEKGNLKALFGQYYKGKLYHISDISNFSEENEKEIKKRLNKGNFVIEIGFQERVPGGLRHQKFVKFRDDKSSRDATMHEFHAKNIGEFKVAKSSDNKPMLSKRGGSIDDVIVELYKAVAKRIKGLKFDIPGVSTSLNFDPNLAFKIMSYLESRNRSHVRGDAGNSYGLTQVHGPYFMKWLASHPQIKAIIGIDPKELVSMSGEWKKNLRELRKAQIWKTVSVNSSDVKNYVASNPKSVVKRLEGTTIRMSPTGSPGVVKKINNRYIGRVLDLELLEEMGLDTDSSATMARLHRVTGRYVTDLVVKSALAQMLLAKKFPMSNAKFQRAFSSKNVKKNYAVRKISDWVSRSDFNTKIRSVVKDIVKSGYDTNAPGAFNAYQLVVIANASGAYRVRRFLLHKKPFSPGNLTYLNRANPVIKKYTGLPVNISNNGMPGFPSKKTSSVVLPRFTEDNAGKFDISKRASYSQSGTLYFPGQYAEDIKSGKRRITIRLGDVDVSPSEIVNCVTYSGGNICDVRVLGKKVMNISRIEKAYGKNMANSLSRRFGQSGRFVVIDFEPVEMNFVDDGDNGKKMSEVLVDKDKKLTRGQIKDHYSKPEIRKKIMSRIKDNPVLVYIGIGKNESVLKRNHDNKEIVITNDDPNKDDQPNNYFYWVKRRLLSFHEVFGTKTDLGFVDLDIHGSFSLDKAKKYARELSKKIKNKYNVSATVYNSGGSGLHVEFKLKEKVSIDKLREELKELLEELNDDWDGVTTGIVKGDGMRSDISTLHNKGSIRVPGAFGESNGNIKSPLGMEQDTDENNYDNAPLTEHKYDYTDPDVPFHDTSIVQVSPHQRVYPVDRYVAYNTVDDVSANRVSNLQKLSTKRYNILMLLAPTEFYEPEYFIPRRTFTEKYGFKVHIASTKDSIKGTQGTVINADKNISEVSVMRYDALFVCGGKGMIKLSKNKEAQELLESFIDKDKPVAMICHAPLLAAEANVIKSKEITGWPDIVGKIKRAGGVWTGMPVERSGLLFTAVGPDEAGDLAYILSNFLLGKQMLIPAEDKLLNWKEAKEKLESIWKLAIDPEEEAKKFWEQHPEFREEEDGDIEEEVVEEEVAAVPSQKPTVMVEQKKEVPEKKVPKPKRLRFKDVAVPVPEKVEEEEPPITTDIPPEKWEEMIGEPEEEPIIPKEPTISPEGPEELFEHEEVSDYLSEYREEELEKKEEEEVPRGESTIMSIELKPPLDKNGEVLDRWFEPGEIEYPKMSKEAKELFTIKNLQSNASITRLFHDPDAWMELKKDPELAQRWLLPALIMSIGKSWFDRNSTRAHLSNKTGSIPFRMFSDRDVDLVERGIQITDLPSSKKYIRLINEHIADITNKYFSYGYVPNPKKPGSLPIGSYIYKALSRRMAKEVALDRNYKETRTPICSYCKSRKRKRQANDAIVSGMISVDDNMEPKRWYCPDCKIQHEENERTVIPKLNEELVELKSKLRESYDDLKKVQESFGEVQTDEMKSKVEITTSTFLEIMEKTRVKKSALDNINKQQVSLSSHITGIPFMHTWCPEPTCPGNRVPLTAIDWNSEFWKDENGKKIAEKIYSAYRIKAPFLQLAEEFGSSEKDKFKRHVSPEWLLDVPFICPHDYVKFTIRSATNKGLDMRGGFLWRPWTTSRWEEISPQEERKVLEDVSPAVEADQEKILDHKLANQTYYYLSKLASKMFKTQYNEEIENYHNWFDNQVKERGKHGFKFTIDKKTGKKKEGLDYGKIYETVKNSRLSKNRQRRLALYETMSDLSNLDPSVFVSWMTNSWMNSKFIVDSEGGIGVENTVVHKPATKDDIYIPILHDWISRIMESRDDWFRYYGMEDILASPEANDIYSMHIRRSNIVPGTFFITRIGNIVDSTDPDSSEVVLGFKPNLKVKKTYRSSIHPKILKVLGIWKLDPEYAMSLSSIDKAGIKPVPIESKIVDYVMNNPQDNRVGDIISSDFRSVFLSSESTVFNMGEYVVVQALLMPGKYNLEMTREIRNLRNESDSRDNIFANLGAFIHGGPMSKEAREKLQEFFKDIQEYGDDEEEMERLTTWLIEDFEEMRKKKASFSLGIRFGSDPLSTYKKKREFDKTPEPEGKIEKKNKHRFVIQLHKAHRAGDHFDLRLENDEGTMTSWAIPKHKLPSGKERLLAMKTEDHPIFYMKFKGKIPEGEYGAGDMEIHDSGTYKEIEWNKSKIVFKLNGRKEKDTFKIFNTDGDRWMIMEEEITEKKGFLLSKRAGQTYTTGSSEYSVDMLIELASVNKIEKIPVIDLKWNLKESVWGKNYSPLDVIENPKKYSKDMKHIRESDLKHPILIYNGEIVDGYHRLSKAVIEGKKTINVRRITDKQLSASRIDKKRKIELGKDKKN
jgi:DNA ligase D-like protein (predicted 3'-phosphoesterase)